MNDHDPLSPLLRRWEHTPAPAPDFRDQVWTRIRSTSETSAPANLLRFPSALPLAASLAILASIAAGTGTAFALNRTLATERMAVAYVRSIDPLQMAAGDSHASHTHP